MSDRLPSVLAGAALIPTIFALASASGRAGVAVIRLSGPATAETLIALTGKLPAPRYATRVRLRDPDIGDLIDDGLALFFSAPFSYTGEDVAELHLHGSRAVLTAMLDLLARRPGLRLAEPGEFTRRAFEHGKLDLTEAEAVADLVDAETSAQRRQALRQLEGALGELYEDWRARLLRALARIEAEIDFPEEGLPPEIWQGVRAEVESLCEEMSAHLADNRRGERLRDGVSVAIIGPPNAGKSSLMNALARRDVAIVSAIAGTTRDVIEIQLDLGGYPVVLADTAGLREAEDVVEQEGVRRAKARAAAADLRVLVLDATQPFDASATDAYGIDVGATDADTMIVANKIDLVAGGKLSWPETPVAIALSVRSGEGMAELLQRLTAEVAQRAASTGAPLITRARHREALTDSVAALARFPEAPLPELAAEDLRSSAKALGRITGRVDVEDMLDVIFREFCIGK